MPVQVKSALFPYFEKASRFALRKGVLNRIPGTRRINDFLFTHLWPYGDYIEIAGSKMYIDWHEEFLLRKTLQTYILRPRWEKLTTNLFEKVVKEGDVVLDLGANLGYFSLLAARLVGSKGKVYAFEPEPRNFRLLLKNIELNGYHNIVPAQKAISNKAGKVELFLSDGDSGAHTIRQHHDKSNFRESVEVESVNLDEFFAGKSHPINVIKMDIEGAEPEAFLGMDRILKENQDLKIFMEFYPAIIREGGNSPEDFAHRLLEDYRFSTVVLDDYGTRQEPLKLNSANELMHFAKNRTALNLFLSRT